MTRKLQLIRPNATISKIERPTVSGTGKTTAVTLVETAIAARVQDHARGLARAGDRITRVNDVVAVYGDRTFFIDLRDAVDALFDVAVGDLVTWSYDDAPTVLRSGAEVVDRRVWRGTPIDHLELSTRGGT